MEREHEKTDERIRLLIADDTALLRLGIRAALSQDESDLEVVGEAENGHQALEMTHALTPDVILMDSTLVGVNGIEVTRLIKQQTPTVAVIVITAFEDEEELFNAIKVGASAYLTMDVKPADLVASVRRAHAGSYLINDSVLARPLLASRVLRQFRELASVGPETEPIFIPLSAREVEVLEHIARGNSNKEIARSLGISDQTVKNHITSILRKLAVNDRTEAVVYALRHGWIKMEQV
ncbi:MAG: response regulator [Chloroflexota bacterium]